MKNKDKDELREEYDFPTMSGGVRGKYAERHAKGTNLVLLDPDVAKAFPTKESVNDALRMLIKIAQESQEDTEQRRKAG